MNDDIREYVFDDVSKLSALSLVSPTGGVEDLSSAIRNVFAGLEQSLANAKEVVDTGNILLLSDQTDCMACGLAGHTADRVKGAGKCIAFDQCGANLAWRGSAEG